MEAALARVREERKEWVVERDALSHEGSELKGQVARLESQVSGHARLLEAVKERERLLQGRIVDGQTEVVLTPCIATPATGAARAMWCFAIGILTVCSMRWACFCCVVGGWVGGKTRVTSLLKAERRAKNKARLDKEELAQGVSALKVQLAAVQQIKESLAKQLRVRSKHTY